jgi:sn-glycerol 3-phosphate transport system permease protein
VWTKTPIAAQLFNSLVIALLVTFGSSVLAFITGVALVYFDTPYKSLIFGLVIATLMLPLEVRIVPTYAVAANVLSPLQSTLEALHLTPLIDALAGKPVRLELNLLDTYAGLSLPLLSTATGTFMFRQFLMSLPKSLAEAARMDGAGPLRFMLDILLPLSLPTFVALGILMFLGAWNQYLWPLLATTDASYMTAVVGLGRLEAGVDSGEIPRYHYQMAAALIVVLPPLLVVGVLQRWMVRGLVISEK